MADFDMILVGGGLANGLISVRLAKSRPDLRLLIVEARGQIGGDHTWSFHASDVTPAQDAWLAEILKFRWPSQKVVFPRHERHLDTGYRTMTSEDLRGHIAGAERIGVRHNARAKEVAYDHVVL